MTTDLPASASADGKKNGYIHSCDITGQRRIYSSCLSIVASKDDERMGILYSDCVVAINKGSCPAMKMQREEVAADKAIYYRDRDIEHIIPKWKGRPRFIPTEPAVVPDNSIVPVANVDYADALSAAIERQMTKAPEVKIEPTVVKQKPKVVLDVLPDVRVGAVPGETLMQMAKRLLEAKSKEASH